jgi:two-component system phosphate regulon sensor histidine kinase PhoR
VSIAVVAAVIIGLLAGVNAGIAFLALTFVLLLGFHYLNQWRLLRWLQSSEPQDIPDASGTWGEIFAHLYRSVKRERQSQRSLAEALVRFRQAGEAMPDGVVVLDAENRIEWMNPSAEEHFGLTLKRDRLQAITNLIRHPAFVSYLGAQNYGEPLVLKGPAESERILSVQLVPYGGQEMLLLSRDVTRWERLESMRRDFIANVSHELRTPITVMKGFLETLSDAREVDEKLFRRSLELMSGQAERMQDLVEDLLMLSRLEDSRYPLREEAIDIPALLHAILTEAEGLNRGQHRIVSRIDNVWLTASREELRSVFSNLISNAIRYTPAGGDISVSWGLVAGEPTFRVDDNGEGIAAEHIPRLTERFYRVDRSRSRSTGGTGLGLAIVKHVLQRHQARLGIESEPGNGSHFYCVFPAERIAAASDVKAEVTPIRAA